MSRLRIPRRSRGRPSAASKATYAADVTTFCDVLKKFDSTLDFKQGSRDWAYWAEGEGLIDKSEIPLCYEKITEFRKSGDLPLFFCLDDDARTPEGFEPDVDDMSAADYADFLMESVWDDARYYRHASIWDTQEHYVEMLVEKKGLKSLFSRVCRTYWVPIANAGGWIDINARGRMACRFKHMEDKGKTCVLLYCGDYDPKGLQISDFLRSNLADIQEADLEDGTGTGWDPSNLIIDRFGLNRDFIDQHNLVWVDNLATSKKDGYPLNDPRHKDHKQAYVQNWLSDVGVRKVEANAMMKTPELSRQLCLDAIEQYIDINAVKRFERRLGQERQKVRAALSNGRTNK